METHEAVFTWVLQQLADAQLVRGKTLGIDATTLDANAALHSIVRRETGETYEVFLTQLAEASGIPTSTPCGQETVRRAKAATSSGCKSHPRPGYFVHPGRSGRCAAV